VCLCKGTGGINIQKSSGVGFHPCPDSNCTFDKSKADGEFKEFEMRVQRFKESRAAV